MNGAPGYNKPLYLTQNIIIIFVSGIIVAAQPLTLYIENFLVAHLFIINTALLGFGPSHVSTDLLHPNDTPNVAAWVTGKAVRSSAGQSVSVQR